MSTAVDEMDDIDDDLPPPRKKREESEMDITPMIDVTFLLLIFFVVASKMDPAKTGTIPEADNGVSISAKESAVIFIDPLGPDKVSLSKLDGSQFSDDEATQAEEIVEYITKELDSSTGKQKDHVMLLGSAEVKVNQVTRIQQIIGDAFSDLEFTYIAVKEQ